MSGVVDPQTRQPLSVGEVGELAIRGPQVMQGYWNMPEETAQVLQDGWLYTGDLATQDEDGFLSIVDRKKDMIVSAGFNVYPREIEEVLVAHPKVAEVAVVGVPSKVREEVVKVFYRARRGPRDDAGRSDAILSRETLQVQDAQAGRVQGRITQERYRQDSQASPTGRGSEEIRVSIFSGKRATGDFSAIRRASPW